MLVGRGSGSSGRGRRSESPCKVVGANCQVEVTAWELGTRMTAGWGVGDARTTADNCGGQRRGRQIAGRRRPATFTDRHRRPGCWRLDLSTRAGYRLPGCTTPRWLDFLLNRIWACQAVRFFLLNGFKSCLCRK
jgi:hypothetical protein